MFTLRRFLLVILCFVVLTAGYHIKKHYWYTITNEHGSGDVIVALGDSLTYGTGASRGEDWPSLVSEKTGITIINKGVPGDTTADALARLDTDVLAYNPRIVIVGLGGNDVLNRLSQDQLFQNLREIIIRIQAEGAMVVVVGINGFPLAGSLGGRYKTIARETGSVYVPNILGGIMTDVKLKSDQIHPNAAGYKIMADRIYEQLNDYL